MGLARVVGDIKFWVLLGLVLGLALGFESGWASDLLVVVMIVQMSLSLDSVRFNRRDLPRYRRPLIVSIVCFFVLATAVTLGIGLTFRWNEGLWHGWAIMACMPCAITVVTGTLYVKGDVRLAVMSLTLVYVISIAFAPLMSSVLFGDSVDPLEILKYILLFVAVPFIISVPLRRLHLTPSAKTMSINVLMFVIVLVSLGSRREYVLGDLGLVAMLAVACAVRICVAFVAFALIYRRLGCERDEGLNYAMMSFWKNSGMAITMTMALFSTVYPEAVLPAIVSTIVETAWFAVMPDVVRRIWPADPDTPETVGRRDPSC